jgi:hypothetical protein
MRSAAPDTRGQVSPKARDMLCMVDAVCSAPLCRFDAVYLAQIEEDPVYWASNVQGGLQWKKELTTAAKNTATYIPSGMVFGARDIAAIVVSVVS